MLYDVIITGGGFAGLTAAIYAVRSGLNCLVFEKGLYGGQVTAAGIVENYPTIPEISGAELSARLYEHAKHENVVIKFESIKECKLNGSVKTVLTSKAAYECKTVILANGTERRKLNCPGEAEYSGKGVSYCATCDGALYKKKITAVIGGGSAALEDGLFLSNVCKKVYIILRRDQFRGEKTLENELRKRENAEIIFNHNVKEIYGREFVDGITIKSTADEERKLAVDGVFIAIGQQPANELYASQVELDANGYIMAGEDCRTSIEGVFAAGDARVKPLRQIITAAADGAVAARQALNYINKIY